MKETTIFLLAVLGLGACGGGDNSNHTEEQAAANVQIFSETKLVGEEVTYTYDGLTMNGYVAYDENAQNKRPGILVVHEWWGHNDYARKRADMLAEMGYVAMAVDMYGDGKKAEHPQDAGAFAGAVMNDVENARGRFEQAMATLKGYEFVDGERMGAIGYCFGGGVVLTMASLGVDLDAVASFHGSLPGVAPEPGTVLAKILVCNGADDGFVSQEAITSFKANMEAADANYQFINYPGAVHSFTSPEADSLGAKFDMPLAYDKDADEQSWEAMKLLFDDAF